MKIGVKKYNITTVFSRGLYCGPRNSSRKVLLDVFGFCLGYARSRFFLKMEQFGPEHEPIAMN